MRVFGEIPGQPVGTTYPDRQAAHDAGVHGPTEAGISGSVAEGADSIVVNGGYRDDEDLGDVIVYTGFGGRDRRSGKQVADQHCKGWNAALAKSGAEALPVRVLRGPGTNPRYAPPRG